MMPIVGDVTPIPMINSVNPTSITTTPIACNAFQSFAVCSITWTRSGVGATGACAVVGGAIIGRPQ